MQVSGVKDERIIWRRPPWRWMTSRATSTKVLSSMATEATPASTASWSRGYSVFSVLVDVGRFSSGRFRGLEETN